MAGRFSMGGWRGWLLLASLCVNVLLVAFVGTQWYKRATSSMLGVGPSRSIEHLARRLPEADREVLRRVSRGKEAALTTAQDEYVRSLRSAVQRLSEPNLDRDAWRAAVMDAREKRMRVGDVFLDIFVEAIPDMSSEGRAKLGKRLRLR